MPEARLEIARHEVEEFVQTRVWKAIVKMAIEQTGAASDANNGIDPFKDPTAICRNQGLIEGMGKIIDYPAVLLEQIEYEKRNKEEDKEDANT